MIERGELFLAGSLDGAGGLYFFDAEGKAKDDTRLLLENDDSIKYKMFIPEIHKWFVPKLGVIFPFKNQKIFKKHKENSK